MVKDFSIENANNKMQYSAASHSSFLCRFSSIKNIFFNILFLILLIFYICYVISEEIMRKFCIFSSKKSQSFEMLY